MSDKNLTAEAFTDLAVDLRGTFIAPEDSTAPISDFCSGVLFLLSASNSVTNLVASA